MRRILFSLLLILGCSALASAQYQAAKPCATFRETDQTLPAGLWRICVDGDKISIEKNTAASGNFSTLVNGIFTPRATTGGGSCDVASGATITPAAATCDEYDVTALAANGITVAAPSGTPVHGQWLILTFKDNGTARSITTWNAIYKASSDLALPATTTVNKRMVLGFKYDANETKWLFLAFLDNF